MNDDDSVAAIHCSACLIFITCEILSKQMSSPPQMQLQTTLVCILSLSFFLWFLLQIVKIERNPGKTPLRIENIWTKLNSVFLLFTVNGKKELGEQTMILFSGFWKRILISERSRTKDKTKMLQTASVKEFNPPLQKTVRLNSSVRSQITAKQTRIFSIWRLLWKLLNFLLRSFPFSLHCNSLRRAESRRFLHN